MIKQLAKEHKLIVTIEENVMNGGFGAAVLTHVLDRSFNVKVLPIALPDEYIEHGSVDVLRQEVMLDQEAIVKRIITAFISAEINALGGL